jgi:PBP1b-binding outer membrane lipoprotein LpoB
MTTKRKKKKTISIIVIILLIISGIGGKYLMDKRTEHERQVAFLKEHEAEMTEYIKSQNSKIETVEYDWDSVQTEKVGNGTPQGGGEIFSLRITILDKLQVKINSFGFSVQPDELKNPQIIKDMYTVNADYNYFKE